LTTFDVRIADLPGTILGVTTPGVIWIDQNAAGHGWFIDATPGNDQEFVVAGNPLTAGRVDLLTVVAHEMGHALGLDHDDDDRDVMAEALPTGVRRVPAVDDVASMPAVAGLNLQAAGMPAAAGPRSLANELAFVVIHPDTVLGSNSILTDLAFAASTYRSGGGLGDMLLGGGQSMVLGSDSRNLFIVRFEKDQSFEGVAPAVNSGEGVFSVFGDDKTTRTDDLGDPLADAAVVDRVFATLVGKTRPAKKSMLT
jgi:hypothetical protein